MLKISKASQYGLRAVICLSEPKFRDTVASIQHIADVAEIPVDFLRKLVIELKKAGIVKTKAGNNGGIQLAKEPEGISVLEVLEASGEKMYLNECVLNPSECPQYKECSIRPVWVEQTYWLRDHFDTITITDLLEEQKTCESELHQDTESREIAVNA